MRIILAVQLLGCIGTGRPVPNICLPGITHTGPTILIDACGNPGAAGQQGKGNPPW